VAGRQLSHGLSSYAIDPASGILATIKEYAVARNPNWEARVGCR
jgi:hypothetical protein